MTTNNNKSGRNANHILKIFNFVGGTLIFFGIAYFINTNWHNLNDFLKIFTTLGSAIAAYLVATLLAADEKYSAASSAFFMVSCLAFPLGLSVTFNIMGVIGNDDMIKVIITGICLFIFLATNFYLQRDILRLFSIFYASLFFIAFTNLLCNQVMHIVNSHLYDYQMLLLGFCYLLGGRYLHLQRNALTGPLYFFGSFFILAASFDLGGLLFFAGVNSEFWKIISPALVLLSFMLAVPLRSKSLLYVGAIFLLIYLFSMTSLFAQLFGNFGWPLLLIMAGLFLMLLGYVLVSIRQRIMK
jgi:hypothetical protein